LLRKTTTRQNNHWWTNFYYEAKCHDSYRIPLDNVIIYYFVNANAVRSLLEHAVSVTACNYFGYNDVIKRVTLKFW